MFLQIVSLIMILVIMGTMTVFVVQNYKKIAELNDSLEGPSAEITREDLSKVVNSINYNDMQLAKSQGVLRDEIDLVDSQIRATNSTSIRNRAKLDAL